RCPPQRALEAQEFAIERPEAPAPVDCQHSLEDRPEDGPLLGGRGTQQLEDAGGRLLAPVALVPLPRALGQISLQLRALLLEVGDPLLHVACHRPPSVNRPPPRWLNHRRFGPECPDRPGSPEPRCPRAPACAAPMAAWLACGRYAEQALPVP